MPGPLDGIRVIEVASWMFIPSGGSILVDWGADVIKVEPVTGDPQRGLVPVELGHKTEPVGVASTQRERDADPHPNRHDIGDAEIRSLPRTGQRVVRAQFTVRPAPGPQLEQQRSANRRNTDGCDVFGRLRHQPEQRDGGDRERDQDQPPETDEIFGQLAQPSSHSEPG